MIIPPLSPCIYPSFQPASRPHTKCGSDAHDPVLPSLQLEASGFWVLDSGVRRAGAPFPQPCHSHMLSPLIQSCDSPKLAQSEERACGRHSHAAGTGRSGACASACARQLHPASARPCCSRAGCRPCSQGSRRSRPACRMRMSGHPMVEGSRLESRVHRCHLQVTLSLWLPPWSCGRRTAQGNSHAASCPRGWSHYCSQSRLACSPTEPPGARWLLKAWLVTGTEPAPQTLAALAGLICA